MSIPIIRINFTKTCQLWTEDKDGNLLLNFHDIESLEKTNSAGYLYSEKSVPEVRDLILFLQKWIGRMEDKKGEARAKQESGTNVQS